MILNVEIRFEDRKNIYRFSRQVKRRDRFCWALKIRK